VELELELELGAGSPAKTGVAVASVMAAANRADLRIYPLKAAVRARKGRDV
jgi:hypothetical protein